LLILSFDVTCFSYLRSNLSCRYRIRSNFLESGQQH